MIFLTVTGTNYRYGTKIFKVGQIVKLEKNRTTQKIPKQSWPFYLGTFYLDT